jgi:hypothetical protein
MGPWPSVRILTQRTHLEVKVLAWTAREGAKVCQLQTDGGCGLLETQDCIDICSAFAGVEASCAAAIEATMDCQIAGGTTTACDTTACQAEMDAQDSDCSS